MIRTKPDPPPVDADGLLPLLVLRVAGFFGLRLTIDFLTAKKVLVYVGSVTILHSPYLARQRRKDFGHFRRVCYAARNVFVFRYHTAFIGAVFTVFDQLAVIAPIVPIML